MAESDGSSCPEAVIRRLGISDEQWSAPSRLPHARHLRPEFAAAMEVHHETGEQVALITGGYGGMGRAKNRLVKKMQSSVMIDTALLRRSGAAE